jgi:hypothetical protein
MIPSRKRSVLKVEELEPRSLPSGLGLFSPVVQADLARLRADVRKLQSDAAALAPTLQMDQQAIQAAIANSPAVKAARAMFTSDLTAWGMVLQADFRAILAATDPTVRGAAVAKFYQDGSSAYQALQADQAAIQNAVNSDPTVLAAQMKFRNDVALLAADQAAVQADFAQLQKDL